MNQLNLPVISPMQILQDLTDCVTTCGQKVSKRLNRLRVVCECLDINPNTFTSNLVIAKEVGIDITQQDVMQFIGPVPTDFKQNVTQDYGIRILTDQDENDNIKKLLSSSLTNALNSDLSLYIATSCIANKIVKRISKHSVFGPLFSHKRIVFVAKGGVAQRLSLLNAFANCSDLVKKIDTAFSLGGDNDTNILVDPQLPDYDNVRQLLVDFVYHCMVEYATRLSATIVEGKAKAVTQVSIPCVDGNLTVGVQAVGRHNFKIYNTGDVSCLDIDICKSGVYTTSNDTLLFTDEIGRRRHFTLLRYKKAVQVHNRTIGAELLDISIPHKDENKYAETFHHYYSGQWVNYINIADII